ncbi:hypothetical protein V1460_04895 [Streptomyces sp. SCSIO 30461]|uniref:hypothetical protein n=1 Tax=Streptomyces sp. SCSIO 30461 TaxID=3118085 RepID=UPI0030D15D46
MPVLTESGVIDSDRVPHPGLVPYQPTDEEVVVAAALAAALSAAPPLYPRVNLALGERRSPVVMELELVEPNLFLAEHPEAL